MDDRESMIDEVIEKFNFERVHIAMTALDWRWANPAGQPGHSVPGLSRLKEMARYLLRETIKNRVVSSGGLEAEYHPKVDDDPEYFELKFIPEHKDSYDD